MSDIDLRLGDCLEILPTLENSSVDAVITDIPYGTTACKWDAIIPLDEMWKQVKRITGVFVTTASQPFTSALIMSNLKWFKYEWIWDKRNTTNFLNCKRMPLSQHNNIVVFANGASVYNPQMGAAGIPSGKRKASRNTESYGEMGNNAKEGLGYPKTIISFARPNHWFKEKASHPTQKPIALYEYLIKTYSNEGDTICDIAMGSGTTGVACVQTGRNFIGIEIDPRYFEIAEKRIAEAQLQLRMPI